MLIARLRAASAPLAAAVAAMLAGALCVAASGADAGAAIGVFAGGIAGSTFALSETLMMTVPLLLCGLAVALAFRAGRFNIGAEGQLLAGMLGAVWLGSAAGFPGSWLLVLPAGALCGALLATLAALLREGRGVSEIVSTLLLNFVMLHLVALAVRGPLQEPGSGLPQSVALLAGAELPVVWPGTRLHLGAPLALALAFLLHALLARTSFGLRLRAAGASPAAARLAGFPLGSDRVAALAISGALAGLSGAVEIAGVTHRLHDAPSPGFGYTAIAVALLARCDLRGVPVAALFFAALDSGCLALQRELGVSRALSFLMQAIALVALLAIDAALAGRRRAAVAA